MPATCKTTVAGIREWRHPSMTQPTRKNQYGPIPPIDPVKRAKSIRDAIAKGKVKRCELIDDTLRLIDEIVASEKQSA
jgi:hypothetical protein